VVDLYGAEDSYCGFFASSDNVGSYQRFRSELTSILKMEAVYSSLTRLSTYKTSQNHNPEVHNI
jgi:hypothetical protein